MLKQRISDNRYFLYHGPSALCPAWYSHDPIWVPALSLTRCLCVKLKTNKQTNKQTNRQAHIEWRKRLLHMDYLLLTVCHIKPRFYQSIEISMQKPRYKHCTWFMNLHPPQDCKLSFWGPDKSRTCNLMRYTNSEVDVYNVY